MKTYKFILSLLVLTVAMTMFMQAEKISGIVYGDISGEGQKPLSGATVKLKDSQVMAITDNQGAFTLDIKLNSDELSVSRIGFKPKNMSVKASENNIKIMLETDESIKADQIDVVEKRDASVTESDLFATTTLSKQSLHKAACCNLSESFETSASVDVSYADAVSGAKQIEMLGLKGTYVQLLTDKIPNVRGLSAPFGLTYIPGNWLDGISISKGASSVATGHESITGQINASYKKPKNSEKLFVNLFAKSNSAVDINVNSKIELGGGWATELFFQTGHNFMEMDNNDDGFLDMSLNHKYLFMNRYHKNKENMHGMIGYYILDESRTGGQVDYLDDKDNTDLYGMEFETKRYEIFGKRAFIFDSDKAYRSFAFITSATYHKQNAIFGHRDYKGEQYTAYLNGVLDIETIDSKHSFDGGFSLEFDKYKETLLDPDHNKRYNMDKEYIVPGLFAEYTFSPLKDIRVVAGVRGDYDFHTEELFFVPRIHAKYEFFPGWHLRGSVGRGWRHAYALAENTSALASSRELVFQEDLKPEEAWNYGVNILGDFWLFERPAMFSVEFFRTDFQNRVIADFDASTSQISFYNLDGQSFSNAFQVDFVMRPFKRFVWTTAYRYNDVEMTYNGQLKQKPLSSPHRGFINLEYATDYRNWVFDFTANYIGGGRLPDMSNNPEAAFLPEEYDPYFMLNAQVTKSFDDLTVFVGCENLTGFTQDNPIIASDNPYGDHFDSSIIYAPITGRKFYIKINYELW